MTNNKRSTSKTVYRTPSDCAHMSEEARHRLLYIKRIPNNKREERILSIIEHPLSNQLYFLYYLIGFCAFIPLSAPGGLGVIFTLIGMGYVLYRYIRLNISIEERLIYQREYPIKTISEVHHEHANDGLRLSGYSVAIAAMLFVIIKIASI